MATAKKKTISPEAKTKAIEMLKAGKAPKEVSDELHINYGSVINWKNAIEGKKVKKTKKQGGGGGGEDIAFLKLENEYLKKKIAILEGKS